MLSGCSSLGRRWSATSYINWLLPTTSTSSLWRPWEVKCGFRACHGMCCCACHTDLLSSFHRLCAWSTHLASHSATLMSCAVSKACMAYLANIPPLSTSTFPRLYWLTPQCEHSLLMLACVPLWSHRRIVMICSSDLPLCIAAPVYSCLPVIC